MGNKPLLSVIVPVYNTRVYLERCIRVFSETNLFALRNYFSR